MVLKVDDSVLMMESELKMVFHSQEGVEGSSGVSRDRLHNLGGE